MRFAALRQVDGPIWVIYDTFLGEIVHSYTDKYAREVASELCDLLNRGTEAKNAEVEATQGMSTVQATVHPGSNRQRVLRSKMQSKEL